MAPIILILISASFLSLGETVPIPTLQPDDSFEDAGTTSFDDDEWTISDQIAQANKDSPVFLIDGDIRLNNKRSALICNSCQWEKSKDGIVIVPYVISPNYTNSSRDLIISATLEFETMTCLRFQNRTTEPDYLSFEDNKGGCWSYIGKVNGRQIVSIDKDSCMSYGTIQHETMHSLGFYHEHNRFDRDNYVAINWQYISKEDKGNFVADRGNTTNIPYDYTSVLHYGRNTYSNTSGEMSIVPIPNPNVTIGQRTGLSSLDVNRINVLYNCSLCRTKLVGASGEFSSSDATPIDMQDNCLWLLHVPSKLISLQFSTFVCLSDNCSANINVYDGVSKNSSLLATIEAGQPLRTLISSGRFLLLEYITDPSTPSSFSGSYSSVAYGGTFTTNGSTVASPNYPSLYPKNVNGTYIIIAPPQNRVILTFSELMIESTPKCSNDYLEIRNGGNRNGTLIGVYCGLLRHMRLKSKGPMVFLHFSSDNNTVIGLGFSANYYFVPLS